MVISSGSETSVSAVVTDSDDFCALGAVPNFQPTQSPDLDTLLAKFRTNVFVPAQLIRLQKQLVYKRSNWQLLTNPDEPATVRLGNEVFQLHPLDRTKDEPSTRTSFHRVLELMQESGNWSNLPGFLEGLKTAKRKIDGAMMQKLVRKANEAGQMGIVLDCVRRVDDTGLGLSDPAVAREVMLGATARANQDHWSEEGLDKAARYAENVWDAMWDPKHVKVVEDGNPKTQPEVLGILVQMHAAKVVLFGAGEEHVGLIQKYANLMLKHWDQAKVPNEKGDLIDANAIMTLWSPTWHGMKMASKVVGKETHLARMLAEKLEGLEQLLQKSRRLLEEESSSSRERRGLKLFKELSIVPPS